MFQTFLPIAAKRYAQALETTYLTTKFKYFILTLFVATFISCDTNQQNDASSKTELDKPRVDTIVKSSIAKLHKDTVALKETYNEDDVIVNEYLTKRLNPIRKNFKRINSITNWTSTNKKDLWESTEGGEATFYYSNGVLEKIVVKIFGETFQQLSEYYLLNGKLSFVFEKSYKYNRPMYYDSTEMKEIKDIEAFDFEKSEIIEDRSYFENGKLIHQLNNQDCVSPFADDYLLEEQKRIKTNFDKLVKLEVEK